MRHTATVLAVLLGGALSLTGGIGIARAADPHPATPEQVVAHHFATIAAGDLDAVMSDYADDAVLISAAGVTRGKPGIRSQFAQLLRPPTTGPRRQADIIEKHFTADVAWLIWVQNAGKPNELRGVETYLVRNGKIRLETVGTVNVHPAAHAAAVTPAPGQ